MGVRIEAYAVDLPRLAKLLQSSLGDLLQRYQADGKNPGERLTFTGIDNDDTFYTTPGGPICAWAGQGPDRRFEELAQERVCTIEALQRPAYEHLSRGTIFQANWLLRGFSNCKGIDFIEVLIDGHRRWWIGSVLQFAHQRLAPHDCDQLDLLFRKILRSYGCGHKRLKNDTGVDSTGLPFTPEDNIDLPFGRWSQEDCINAVPLLSRIMEMSPSFTPPPGPLGLGPDESEWHDWVCENVTALLGLRKLGYGTLNLLTFIG